MTALETQAAAGGASPLLAAGGWATAAGALGVSVTTAFYAVSPPAAAMPAQPLELMAALQGAVSGAHTMLAASSVGILSDVVLATGLLLIAFETARRGRGAAAAGWAALFISALIFTVVDAIVGRVLVPLAAAQGEAMAFLGFKLLFDTLFLLGSVVFGGGTVLALASECRARAPLVAKPLAHAGIAAGMLGIVSALACFARLPLELAVGVSIGAASVIFIAVGVQLARAGAPVPVSYGGR